MRYILAADDEDINRDIIEEILGDFYEIKSVVDGNECLESIEKRIPDLLLLDVGMPGMNGIDVCKVLRANEETSALPIFLLSGYASRVDIDTGIDAGANEYVSKPFRPKELIDAIKRYLGE